jgi:hypothetical protein
MKKKKEEENKRFRAAVILPVNHVLLLLVVRGRLQDQATRQVRFVEPHEHISIIDVLQDHKLQREYYANAKKGHEKPHSRSIYLLLYLC